MRTLLLLPSLAVALLLAPAAAHAASPPPPFGPVVVPADAEGPTGLAVIDADGDGKDDAVVALAGGDEVMVLRGGGRGAPMPGSRFAVGDGPISVIAGDVDGDGRSDLAVLNFNSADLSILLARGEGFQPESRQTFLPGADRNDLEAGAFRAMALADFDGDGLTDLAVAHRHGVSLLRGHGDGSFTILGQVAAGDRPYSVVAADFDADGRIDLATSNIASDDVVLLRGRGDGTFEALPGVPAGITPRGLAAGDLDNDGVLDLVTANQYSGDPLEPVGDVSVLLGLGDGRFRPAVRHRTGRTTTGVVLGDFNEDGHLDIAASNVVSGDVSILRGAGDGTFGAQVPVRIGVTPGDLLALDRDGDGHLDLAATIGPAGISFVDGDGGGGFVTHATRELIVRPTRVAAADLDGDGRQDLIVAGRQRSGQTADVALLPGRGNGGFEEPINLDLTEFSSGFTDIAVGDFDGDGHGDFALAGDARHVGIVMGRGRWEFAPAAWLETGFQPLALSVADFNGDRRPDLAVAHGSTDGILILLGRGDGGFDPGERLPTGDDLVDIVTDDFDGDGRVDVAAVGTELTADLGYRDLAQVYGGTGDGRFRDPVLLDVVNSPTAMVGGDFNGDGLADLLVTGTLGITLLVNRGHLDFAPGVQYPGPWFMSDVLAADFTRDGTADAAVLSPQWEVVSVIPGNGDGTLGPEMRSVGGRSVAAFAAGDLDGDGAPDLVTANAGLRDAFVGNLPYMSLMRNLAPAPNRAPVAVAVAPDEAECTSADGARVRLDGTGSHDPDAEPGVADDLASLTWFEDYGSSYERALGAGPVIDVTLGLGRHALTLLVTDRGGASDTDAFDITIEDTRPPSLDLRVVGVSVLWPPDHRLAEVAVAAEVRDQCGPALVTLVSVSSSEPDDAPGDGDGDTSGDVRDADIGSADLDFLVRAERAAAGQGRTYTAVYRARDAQGLLTDRAIAVTVPHDPRSTRSAPVLAH